VELVQIVILAMVQGLTEFLPISSSAHLILPQELLGWDDQGLAFDIAVHVGTLVAVLAYFRHEVVAMSYGWLGSVFRQEYSHDGRLAWYLILATIPVCIAGVLLAGLVETELRSASVIASTTVIFGVLLGYADHGTHKRAHPNTLNWRIALFIGCAQMLSLVPGTSRSGITMTAALIAGTGRTEAARFSFLLSIPAILASGSYKAIELISQPIAPVWSDLALGAVLAAVTAYLCIHWFLALVERIGMMPFVIYRLLLGAVLFFLILAV